MRKNGKMRKMNTPLHLEPSERQAIETASIREFKVPDINSQAKSYPDLIDWKKASFSEPPMTSFQGGGIGFC